MSPARSRGVSPARAAARPLALAAAALGLTLALGACGGVSGNRLLDSVHQPVIDHASYTLDVGVTPDGIGPAEAQRLGDWFDAMNLRYGDKVTIEDPLGNPATRAAISAVVARFGLLVLADTPPGQGYVNAGSARVVITRAIATVPHCPDWSSNSETNLNNSTSSNYGCAVNSNLAAEIADPDELLHGVSNRNSNTASRSTKAINAYTYAAPSNTQALKVDSHQERELSR